MSSTLKTAVTANTAGLTDLTTAEAADVLNPITDLLTHVKSGRVSVTAADTHVKHLSDAFIVGDGLESSILNPGGNEQIKLTAKDAIVPLTVMGAGAVSIDFAGIPATYEHLRLTLGLRTADASTLAHLVVRCNDDVAAANYATLTTFLQHSAALTTAEALEGAITGGYITNSVTGNSAPAGFQGVMYLDFYEYAQTGRPRTCRWSGLVRPGLASGEIRLTEGWFMWKNTAAALNKIVVYTASGLNFMPGSTYALYGVR